MLAFPLQMTSWQIPGGSLTNVAIVDNINNLNNFNDLTKIQSASPLTWIGFQQSIIASFPFLASSAQSLQETLDGMTMATPLIEFKMAGNSALLEARDLGLSIFSRESETGWELINISSGTLM